jgi:poly-beta-1,6-N-acetyl-D-glucosamine synthase
MASILFWASIGLVAYTFIGYPMALFFWSRVKPRAWQQQPWEPNISIVISAYNEAASIVTKIRNLLALDYPPERVEILVGSDGSTDGTAEQLLTVSDERIRVFILPQRRGKPAVLNALIPKAHGEIIVLADVRQMFDAQALRALARPLADPQVGAVTGELMLTGGASSGAYWRYEKFVRSREYIVDSTIGATGAIYAIRKSLFEPIPPDTILDDVLIPMRITRRGYRVVFERDAHAYEAPAPSREEFKRKVRTLSGNFQLFARDRWLLNPLQNRLWWQTLSHKALRLFVAPLQLVAFIANVVLADASVVYEFILVAQLLFYAGAIAGWILPQHRRKQMALALPYIFCLLSWATVCAFWRWINGRQPVTWQKATANSTPR